MKRTMQFCFFEQDVIDMIEHALHGDETIEVGEIHESYAYDYFLPQGCASLGFPKCTAIEVKKRLVPGLNAILINDAEHAFITGRYNAFIVLYEEGIVNEDWIPSRISGFLKFVSPTQFESLISMTDTEMEIRDWKDVRDLRIGQLIKDLRAAQNTLFVGAGLSCSLKVPGWGDLLKKLTKQMRNNVSHYPTYQSIKNDGGKSYLIIARYLYDSADRNSFSIISEIRKKLYKKQKLRSPLMDSLIELLKHRRIGEIITYNYDNLLEQRMTLERIANSSVERHNKRLKNALPVIHVHGLIHPTDMSFDSSVVLNEKEYHELYRDSYHWANVEQLYVLTHSTCIFVGLSMTDPNLRRILDIAYEQGSGDVDHYAFLIRNEFKCPEQTENVMSQMGVTIIWCEDKDDVPNQLMRIA